MILGHGDDIYRHKYKIVSNFSSNVNTHQDLSALRQHLCEHMEVIHSYPEADAHSLAQLLAEKNSVESQHISVTNGATEAIYLIAQAFANQKTSILIPTFSEYEDACTIHNHNLTFCTDISDLLPDNQLVWICNPNNPTGKVYDKKDLISLINKYPKTTFVFDQSYESFCQEDLFSISEAMLSPNVILLHSMTKNYAIPGLRLGYISANEVLLNKINTYRMPWSVNQLAIEAGKFLLKHNLNQSLKERLHIAAELFVNMSTIEGVQIFPSQTTFFLCKLEEKKASDLKEYLIQNHGILIRDARNFRGLNERYFRIASQNNVENMNLITAIRQWI